MSIAQRMIREKQSMEQMAELPPVALAFFGIALALIFAVRYLGLLSGSNVTPEKSAAAAQVAAVIVDSTALNRASNALESHTLAVNRQIAVAERQLGLFDDVRKALSECSEELGRIREEMRIQREVRRDR